MDPNGLLWNIAISAHISSKLHFYSFNPLNMIILYILSIKLNWAENIIIRSLNLGSQVDADFLSGSSQYNSNKNDKQGPVLQGHTCIYQNNKAKAIVYT